jgi:hypothetical protein
MATTNLRFVVAGVGRTTHTIMISTLGTFSILVIIEYVRLLLNLIHSQIFVQS